MYWAGTDTAGSYSVGIIKFGMYMTGTDMASTYRVGQEGQEYTT